ncbi:hypothetical protein PND81_09745 [Flavonifractor plautii]|nr:MULTISPECIES: hypothetical protein [Oscillospiraceae]MDB7901596.1 hypothetical protein [Flavonifractor plautii]
MLQLAKAVLQRFDDFRFIFRPHSPKRDGLGEVPLMGVGNVKVIFQPGPARMLAVKNSNAIRAPVYPAPKPFIPSLDLQDGGGVRALGIDKQLLIKGKTVVAAG